MNFLGNYFTFGDHASTEFSLYLSGEHAYDSPERNYGSIEVIGRNGNLITDYGNFKNKVLSYPVFAIGDFRRKADDVKQWLLAPKGYQIFRDTYNPNTFRKAIYKGSIDFDVAALCQAGKANLTFEFAPQRYLDAGENWFAITKGEVRTFTNPTKFDALPFIELRGQGSGVITVGNTNIVVTGNSHSAINIDCELQEAYYYQFNCNKFIGYLDKYPVLPPGDTGITYTGDFTSVRIKPRWWRI